MMVWRHASLVSLLMVAPLAGAVGNPFVPPPPPEAPKTAPPPPPAERLAEEKRRAEAEAEARRKAAARRKAILTAEKKLFETIRYVGVIDGQFLYWDPESKCYLVFRNRPSLAHLVRDGCGRRVWLRTDPG